MKNIALGRYIPYNSIIHRLDSRIKIFSMIILFVIIFLPNLTLECYLALIVLLVVLIKLTHLKIKNQLKTLKAMWFMLFFLLIINIFIRKSGDMLVDLNGFKIYSDAIIFTLEIVVRMFLLISISTILSTSTKPLDLTNGLEWYMTPLKIVKFPAHEIAMIISIAIRFIPTILEEAQRIIKAQTCRGVDLEHGKFKDKITGIVSLIFPLFISAFERAGDLADAMESRGYNPNGKRTKYHQQAFALRDLATFFVVTGLLVFFIYFKTLSIIPIADIKKLF